MAKVHTLDAGIAIVAASCIIYVAHLALTARYDPNALFRPSGFLSIGSPSNKVIALFGGTSGAHLRAGYIWTLFTANYSHANLLHIGFNLYWFRSLAGLLQSIWGAPRVFTLFTLAGLGGFLASDVLSGAPTVGASCSIFGMIGGIAVFGWRRGGAAGAALKDQAIRSIFMAVFYTLFLSNVNHIGHFGGLASGVAVAFLLPAVERQPSKRSDVIIATVLALATAGSFVAAVLFSFVIG